MVNLVENSRIYFKFVVKEINDLVIGKISSIEAFKAQLAKIIADLDKTDTKQNHASSIAIAVKYVVSHLEAINHYRKFIEGSSLFDRDAGVSIEKCIQNGKHLLTAFQENFSLKITTNPNNTADLGPQPNYQKISTLRAEQKWLNSFVSQNNTSQASSPIHSRFKYFLHEIWRYAVDNQSVSKTAFLSYAWPTSDAEYAHEYWTRSFVKNLAKHLIYAGIKVYFDRYHSGVGNDLNSFMQKIIHEADQVIVLDTKTWLYKATKDGQTGVKFEYEQIKNAIEKHKLDDQKFTTTEFITTVIATDYRNCHELLKEADEINFYKLGYLSGIKQLISKLYNFEQKAFNEKWKALLEKYQLVNNGWGLPPKNNNFIGRTDLLKQLAELAEKQVVVVQGEEGSGKTQLVLQHVYQSRYNYSAVYWFDAADLTRDYLRLGDDKGLFEPSNLTDEQKIEKVKQYLALQASCLIIYDNMSEGLDIGSLQYQNNSVIFITRSILFEKLYPIIPVSAFSKAEAEQFLETFLSATTFKRYPIATEALFEKIEKIDYLPGRLARICHIIQYQTKSIPIFLNLYGNNLEQLSNNQAILFRPTLIQSRPTSVDAQSKSLIDSGSSIAFKNEQINSYYFSLNNLYNKFATEHWFSDVSAILNEIIKQIRELAKLDQNVEMFKQSLYVIHRHFESLSNYLQASYNELGHNFLTDFQAVNKLGHELVFGYKPQLISIEKGKSKLSKTEGAIDNREDAELAERKRVEEQHWFNTQAYNKATGELLCKRFLREIWLYALTDIESLKSTKKIYILFAEPCSEKDQWTKLFVKHLKSHLTYAGIQVSMNKVSCSWDDFDHVLVVSTPAFKERYKDEHSFIHKQCNQLAKYRKNRQQQNIPFLLPILLTYKNYLPDWLKSMAELSFCSTTHYLNPLQELLQKLYGFPTEKFGRFWRQQLVKNNLQNNLWQVPPANSYFVERQALTKIAAHFKTSSALLAIAPSKETSMISACGLGGVGKTTIAVAYARQYAHEYEKVCWFIADSAQNLITAYGKLGIELKFFTEEKQRLQPELCARILMNHLQKNWLLIYDNVENYEHIKDWLPTESKILITSRHIQWENPIRVDVYTKEEALTYISNVLGKTKVNDNIKEAEELSKELGYLPLALAQACAYLVQNKGISIKNYLELYKQKRQELLSYEDQLDGETIKPVAVTWQITLERIQGDSIFEEPADAIKLLYYCAYYSEHSAISQMLINACFDSDEIKAYQAREIAQNYSMIIVDEDCNSVAMHGLVQKVLISNLKAHGIFDKFLHHSAAALCSIYKYGDQTLNAHNLRKELFPHFENVFLNYLPGGLTEKTIHCCSEFANTMLRLLLYIGDAYDLLGKPLAAKNIFIQLEKLRETGVYADQAELATAKHRLGRIYGLLGNFNEKLKKLTEGFKIKEKLKDPIDLAQDYEALGTAYAELGDKDMAIANFKRALELGEAKYYLEDSENLARITFNLGAHFLATQDYEKAKSYLDSARNIYENHANKMGLVNVYQHLALIYKKSKDWETTDRLLSSALKILEDLKMNDKYIMGRLCLEYGSFLLVTSKLEDAERFMHEAVRIFKMNFKENNICVVNALEGLGRVYYAKSEVVSEPHCKINFLNEAEKYLQQVIIITQELPHNDAFFKNFDLVNIQRNLNNIARIKNRIKNEHSSNLLNPSNSDGNSYFFHNKQATKIVTDKLQEAAPHNVSCEANYKM